MKKSTIKLIVMIAAAILAALLIGSMALAFKPDSNTPGTGGSDSTSTGNGTGTGEGNTVTVCEHPSELIEVTYLSLGDQLHMSMGKCTGCGKTVQSNKTSAHEYVAQTVKGDDDVAQTLAVCSQCNWSCVHEGDRVLTYAGASSTQHTTYASCSSCGLQLSENLMAHVADAGNSYGYGVNDTYHETVYTCVHCGYSWIEHEKHSYTSGICDECVWFCSHDVLSGPSNGYYYCVDCDYLQCAHETSSAATYEKYDTEKHIAYYKCDQCGTSRYSLKKAHVAGAGNSYGYGVNDTYHETVYTCVHCRYSWIELEEHTYSSGFCDECVWFCSHEAGYTGDEESGFYCYTCGMPASN